MNETDKLKFYNVYSAMRAIRLMRQEDAMLYHRLFSGDEKKSKQSINIALAKSYIAIASGVSPKDIPKDFLTNSTSDDRECWRSYFRRGRDFFRSHYNLPGIGAGWLSESRLLTIVRNIFPAEVVHHNSRPTFLEGLQLDVYIPRINVAFEYMGRQHYEPVDFFGGEVAFESVKKRDAKKRQLCAEHGVRLIHVHYDDELSEGNIRRLMRS